MTARRGAARRGEARQSAERETAEGNGGDEGGREGERRGREVGCFGMGWVGWSEGAEVGERVEGYRRCRRRHPLTISLPCPHRRRHHCRRRRRRRPGFFTTHLQKTVALYSILRRARDPRKVKE